MTKATAWAPTGEARIVPWYFGLMRAEFEERRDFAGYGGWPTEEEKKDPNFDAGGTYQTRWVGAGRLPLEYDNSGPFGYWSTLSTPRDASYGMRAVWRQFIQHFRKIEPKVAERQS